MRRCTSESGHGKIKWTAEAERWLKEILDYIAEDNPEAAIDTIVGIYDRAQVLLSHPEIGTQYGAISDRNIRILLYEHYRITYLVKSNNDIDILGVFHGALDIKRYIL